jgi:NADH-quinone oxidoreductase subunit E
MSQNSLIQSDRFVLSDSERSAIEHELHHYEDSRAASIGALKIVQEARGWVPDGAIAAIGAIIGIPASDVEGVATFYSQIFRQPVGRHIIRVCDSMVCYIGGHESVVSSIQQQLGIGLGETSSDGRFTLLPVCCLGNCDKAPALMIDDHTFGDVQPDGVAKLLENYP